MAQDQAYSLFSDQSESTEADQDSVPATETSAIAEAVESVPQNYDLNSVDGIRAAAEQSDAMKNYLEKMRLDTVNAERQRIQNEMRREQGSVDKANAYHQYLVNQLNDGADIEELRKQTPLYVAANEGWLRTGMYQTLAEEAIAMADEDQREFMRGVLSKAMDANDVRVIATESLNALKQKTKREHLAELNPDTLLETPKFKEWLDDQVSKRIAEEASAQKTQSTRRVNAPNIPIGSAPSVGINPVEFANMSTRDQERTLSSLTPQQEDALMTSMYEAARKGQ